jgi:putative transcriptional regulator
MDIIRREMEMNIDFFSIVNDNVAGKGRILISEPFLSDHYFRRSIVYLTEHNEQGSLGFVLNKPIQMKVSEIVNDFPDADFSISVGGPVSTNTVHYIHTLGERVPESVPVTDGIYWGGDFNVLKDLVSSGRVAPQELRFFLGYAGWSADQLDKELKENAWLVGKIPPGVVMKAVENEFWSSLLRRYKNKYKAWANFPDDPGLN